MAKRFSDDLQAGSTAKVYLARVMGDFGSGLGDISAWQRPAALLKANERQLGWCLEGGQGEVEKTSTEKEEPANETELKNEIAGSVQRSSSSMEEVSQKVRNGNEVRVQQSIR